MKTKNKSCKGALHPSLDIFFYQFRLRVWISGSTSASGWSCFPAFCTLWPTLPDTGLF